MTAFYIGILLLWLNFPLLQDGSSTEEMKYDFCQSDSAYSFSGSFIIETELECLIRIVSDFRHISKYASGAKSVELIRQRNNWTEVSYTYRRFLFLENKSVWRRTLYREKLELVFELISSENNMKIMPEMRSSSGYYRIKPSDDGFQIEYFQVCNLTTDLLTTTYIRKVKEEAIKFLHDFRKYIMQTCV